MFSIEHGYITLSKGNFQSSKLYSFLSNTSLRSTLYCILLTRFIQIRIMLYKVGLPLKRLVSPQLHPGKVQMPCKVARVPRQRPNSLFFMLITDLCMTKVLQNRKYQGHNINLCISCLEITSVSNDFLKSFSNCDCMS